LKATDEKVSYCGLYCGCCVMEEARVLSDALRKRIEFFGKYEDQVPELRGNWRSFMKVLEFFGQKCNGCRHGGRDPNCRIKVCAQERGVFFCGECDDFPCEKIGRYEKSIEEIMKMGMEKWLEKQQRKTKVISKPIFAE